MRRLATGGTSDVLLAKAEGPHGFERTVVLKVLLAQFQDDEEAMAMFAREATAYARLSHSSIVQLYDFFALEGQLVMVLEYVDGPALHRLRAMLRTTGQQVEDRAALWIASRVFSALAAAHATRDEAGRPAPVIHRDVNPSNILLPWDGHVKLADFGVAKVTGASHQSQVGVLKGTYGYMAPEQVTGEPVTPATDVYAGTIVLWELLTRRRAFQRGALPEVEALRQMSEPRIPSLESLRPELPAGLVALVRRALDPDVRTREVTAEEALSVLRSLVADSEGRESLAASLASVRHEPRASMTSIPPAEDETARVALATRSPSSRTPGPPPVGPGRRAPSRPNLPRPPVPSSPSGVVTSAPRLDKVGAPAKMFPDAPATARGQTPPPPRPGPRKPSTPPPPETSPMPRLAGAASEGNNEETRRAPAPGAPVPTSASGPVSLLFGTPSNPVALKAAIDEILRDVPSTIPPEVFSVPGSDPALVAAAHAIGALPPAPAPLVASRSPSEPLSFPGHDTTLAMEARPRVPSAPGGSVSVAPAQLPSLRPEDDPFEPSMRLLPSVAFDDEVAAATMPFGASPRGDALASVETVVKSSPAEGNEPTAVGPSAVAAAEMAGHEDTAVGATLVANGAAAQVGSSPPPYGAPAVTLMSPGMSRPPSAGSEGSGPPPPYAAPSAPPPPYGSTPSAPPAAYGAAPSAPPHVGVPTVPPAAALAAPTRRGRGPLVALVALVVLGAAGGAAWTQRARLSALASSARPEPKPGPRPTSASATSPARPSAPPSASAPPPVPASASSPAPAPAPAPASASASAPASASASAPAPAPASASVSAPAPASPRGSTGTLRTAGATPNRRIFVDDVTVGQTPDSLTVKCGTRAVKLGSTGRVQRVEVPCGGEVTVSDR